METDEIQLCDCCMMFEVNNDVSSCVDYYHHDDEIHPRSLLHNISKYKNVVMVADEPYITRRETTCDGCSGPILPMGNVWEFEGVYVP